MMEKNFFNIILFLIIIFAILIQKIFFFSFFKPEIVLLIIISAGLIKGSQYGAILGFWAGLIQGLFFFPILSWYMFSFCLIGFLSGLLGERIFSENVIFPLIASILATLFYSLLFLGLSKICNLSGFSFNFNKSILSHLVLYNLIFMIPVFYLCHFIFKKSSNIIINASCKFS